MILGYDLLMMIHFYTSMDRVITISEVRDDETIEMYHKFIRQQEQRNSAPQLKSQQGYVNSVTDARKMFEKLYNSKEEESKDNRSLKLHRVIVSIIRGVVKSFR